MTENLPLSVLPNGQKIAISVQIPIPFLEKKQKKKKKFPILSHLSTIRKSMSISMIHNENESIKLYGKDVLFIRLESYEIGYYDFKQTEQMIEAGYKATQKYITKQNYE